MSQRIILRDYQARAVEKGLEYMEGKSSSPSLIVAATGSGKSLMISSIANQSKGNTLVLQPSVELLRQNYAKSIALGGNPTIFSASARTKEISGFMYATLGSIKKHTKELRDVGIRNLLIDECHAGYSPKEGSEFSKFIEEMDFKKVIGFTATPFRLTYYSSIVGEKYSQLNMLTRMSPRYFKKYLDVTQIGEMINRRFWAPLEYEVWSYDDSMLVLNSSGSEYTEDSIARSIQANGVNNTIYKRLRELVKEKRSILVFLDSVENCIRMSAFFNSKVENTSAVIHANTPGKEREKIIESFKAGKMKILFNVQALSVGFDHPGIDCVIFGRPTFSLSVYYQVLGRAVRIDPLGIKKDALIIDAVDNMSRFGKIEDLSIEDFPGYGYGVFSKNKLLTNIPIGMDVTMDELCERYISSLGKEKLPPIKGRQSIGGRFTNPLSGTIMWFGKYEGQRFESIPIHYFTYLVNNIKRDARNEVIFQYMEQIIQ